MKNTIKLFEDEKIRVEWDGDKEKWYFSVVDVIAVLTDNDFQGARKYWNKLAQRLREEGNQTVTNCHQLKLLASDGKLRFTDVANTEQILRLVQSIPSKKAEPFKLWLAKVGSERIDEIENPELAIDRAMKTYLAKGYSEKWINQRLKTIEVRKELTDEWRRSGVEDGQEFAILTNEITLAWSGKSIREYKDFKNLKRANLRDNMTNLELVLNMLAEATTAEISKEESPEEFDESLGVARRGGGVAGVARHKIEEELGRTIVSKDNYLDLQKNKKLEKKKIKITEKKND